LSAGGREFVVLTRQNLLLLGLARATLLTASERMLQTPINPEIDTVSRFFGGFSDDWSIDFDESWSGGPGSISPTFAGRN
jgi:hypothetical protein